MDQIHGQIDKFFREIENVAVDKNLGLHILGRVFGGFPIYLLSPRDRNDDCPRLLIAGGFHGDEPAGCLGILEFLKNSYDLFVERSLLSFLPLVNPTGICHNTRVNWQQQDPNRGFCHTNSGAPELSAEGKFLLNHISLLKFLGKHGFLSLHEDVDSNCFYLYTFENREGGEFSQGLRDAGQKFFPICDDIIDGEVEGGMNRIQAGLIFRECDGSFEDFLFHSGVPRTATTETPGLDPISKRIDASVYLIQRFVSISLDLWHNVSNDSTEKRSASIKWWEK